MVDDVAAHAVGVRAQGRPSRTTVERLHMLGTSGTVTTMAGIHLRLPRYDRRRVDGLWMSAVEIDGVLDELLGHDL